MMGRGSIFYRLSMEAVLAALTASAAAYLFYAMVGHIARMAIFEQAGVKAWEFLSVVFVISFPVFLGILVILDDKVWRRSR